MKKWRNIQRDAYIRNGTLHCTQGDAERGKYPWATDFKACKIIPICV